MWAYALGGLLRQAVPAPLDCRHTICSWSKAIIASKLIEGGRVPSMCFDCGNVTMVEEGPCRDSGEGRWAWVCAALRKWNGPETAR